MEPTAMVAVVAADSVENWAAVVAAGPFEEEGRAERRPPSVVESAGMRSNWAKATGRPC